MENATEFLQTQRKDIYYVDARLLNVVPDFNVRQDYGDMEELVESIRENGVKVPIRGYKKDGVLYIVDGHRRLKACQVLILQGVEMRVPYLPEAGASVEQRVIDMITLNDGKKLNALEESEAVKRLINYGISEYEIAKKVGRTPRYIYNLKLLSNAPQTLKTMIRSNIISATLVVDILKSAESFEEATAIIEKAYYNNSNKGQHKQTRVTKKDIDNAAKKVNSFAELKKTFTEASKKDWEYKEEQRTLIEFLFKVFNGELRQIDFKEMFFDATTEIEQEELSNAFDTTDVRSPYKENHEMGEPTQYPSNEEEASAEFPNLNDEMSDFPDSEEEGLND